MKKTIVFIDSEIGEDNKIKDLGAVYENGAEFHSASISGFNKFLSDGEYICGHNILRHDWKYISPLLLPNAQFIFIDTLFLSPLMFPQRPYHSLLKDEKLISEELNNPLSDAKKAKKLFYDEVNAFLALDHSVKTIYYSLLSSQDEFCGFFRYTEFSEKCDDTAKVIRKTFFGKICENADLQALILQRPVELAYALALIGTEDYHSVTPPWLIHNLPHIENVVKLLCNTRCKNGCEYCNFVLDIHKNLKDFFGYSEFRTYDGEPLQEQAAQAAACGKSLLAVFPTGGGKSITFQLPALMSGQRERGLTVVISPLQSLMKDQVDNLAERGLTDAVTINGLLSPIERTEAFERVESGLASILYISPEQLRSRTIERLLLSRNVVRFVIDEAHCFSAWGQDFRVDYLYIGDFIREYQEKKSLDNIIPVSCFTATAKQKVISDICDYFKEKLSLDLKLFATGAQRKNLRYTVLYKKSDAEKYATLRQLIEQKNCPTIVYASRTKRTLKLSEALSKDGFPALHYNGKMDSPEKIANQEAFMNGSVKIIVATSAFGMGVDKKDVGLVVHYDISDSLENYVQEAGRAGRDPSLNADCYVLYNDDDLNKHFILLNQTKVSIGDIQMVWSAMKNIMKFRPCVQCSALEIAREAGWDDTVSDVETRVKTAISALEQAGYVKRGHNVPHVYATSILAKNIEEARLKIENSGLFSENEVLQSVRIIKCLISERSRLPDDAEQAESRIDYLADMLSMNKRDVICCVNKMRQGNILADTMDMSVYIYSGESENRALKILEQFAKLEKFLLLQFSSEEEEYNIKELNEAAQETGIAFSNIKRITTLLFFLTIKDYIAKDRCGRDNIKIRAKNNSDDLIKRFYKRYKIAQFIVEKLYSQGKQSVKTQTSRDISLVHFSLVGIFRDFSDQRDFTDEEITLADVEDALLYLSKIGAMRLEGGFFVLYNTLELRRLILDNKIRYKKEDYRSLDEYYKHKIQQIHIVGEFANLMVKDYNAALEFVHDYFHIDFKKFISKYFKGERGEEIIRNISPQKYHQIVDGLSQTQKQIVNNAESKYIVVAAGPGSGKTRVLVHKLASLMMLEDAKHEQLLMLTFSRAAATEFKKRLIEIIGNAANFIEIKTFHSYCFDLLGKIGSLDGVKEVIPKAVQMIENGEVEPGRIAKSVLVIDEAQDMDRDEFALVQALIRHNEDMRVIAVGDDDQNIYEFRRSNSRYMRSFSEYPQAVLYELLDNYRSRKNIVAFANEFAKTINNRIKNKPICAVNPENGIVEITRCKTPNLEIPLAEKISSTYQGGRACVLTQTNTEALQMCTLLNKKGIRARLIQTLDGFRLSDLAEIRYFLKKIDESLQSAVISDQIWENAKSALNKYFHDSTCLENCNNLIADFEKTHSYSKYRTDLEEFIKESNYDDFYSDDLEAVYVSTIHKAKGREFDSVYMLLNNFKPDGGEESRKIYVGITRAKTALYILTNTDFFYNFSTADIVKTTDNNNYGTINEIVLQLTHRDVVLDFLRDKKSIIFKLKSGIPLKVEGNYLAAQIDGKTTRIAKFSQKFVNNIEELFKKKYHIVGAQLRFIVAWKGENDTSFTAVPLSDIFFEC